MRKMIFLAFALLFLSANSSEAATSGNCGARSGAGTTESPYVYADTCTWKIEDGVLTISGNGDMADMGYRGAPWYSERSSVTGVIIGDGITNVGTFAFFEMFGIKNLSLPDTITKIGTDAFAYVEGVSELRIPPAVTSVGTDAFFDMRLDKLTIPDSVNVSNFGWRGFILNYPTQIEISAENLQKYLNAEGGFGGFQRGNFEVICSVGDCQAVLEAWDAAHGTNYMSNATFRAKEQEIHNADGSISIYEDGQLVGYRGKRIYTVEEATRLSKPTGNTFKLRYK